MAEVRKTVSLPVLTHKIDPAHCLSLFDDFVSRIECFIEDVVEKEKLIEERYFQQIFLANALNFHHFFMVFLLEVVTEIVVEINLTQSYHQRMLTVYYLLDLQTCKQLLFPERIPFSNCINKPSTSHTCCSLEDKVE